MNRVVADFSPKRGGRNDGGEVSQQFVARWKARGVYGSSKTIEKVYSAGWKYPARITSCIRVRGRFAWMYVTRTMLIDNCFHFHIREIYDPVLPYTSSSWESVYYISSYCEEEIYRIHRAKKIYRSR